jgi:hypothetical protein
LVAFTTNITQEKVSAWMDKYFAAVRECIGPLEKVPELGKLFTGDFDFVYYTPPSTAEFAGKRAFREGLLVQMVHPGLREIIEPDYYAINLERLMVYVRFNDRTVDEASGKDIVPPFQASAHYTLVPAEDTRIQDQAAGILDLEPDSQKHRHNAGGLVQKQQIRFREHCP